MNKNELRKKYKTLREHLSLEAIEEHSLAIANRLLKLDIWNKTYYHLFLTIKEKKEVDTLFIQHILAGKDKEIVMSKSNFTTLKMTHFLVTENTKFRKNLHNITEPIDGIEVPVSKIEVVFVPLLAFDKNGNRVGYGKGFYDAFLTNCSPKTIKIGLSFFEAEEEAIEGVFENDIQLNLCVTPYQTYIF